MTFDLFDTIPDPRRERSYNGGYMAAGRASEEIVLAWLARRPWVIGVEDLRSLRQMREADVDCGVSLIDGRNTLAEIKSDAHLDRSGNFWFEVLRVNHTAPPDRSVTLGWSARSPARVLIFHAPSSRKIHVIPMDQFRTAMQGYTVSTRKFCLNIVPTDCIKSTVNILIPAHHVVTQPGYKNYDDEQER
jgi:hypothetical protein